jgi:hypothetical protein
MPGNTKRRRRKHRGTKTGKIETRGKTTPRNRQEAMNRARNQGKRAPDRRDSPPTWRGAMLRGGFFAVLLFPIALLFGQEPAAAAILTVIAAIFYVPLGFYTDQFFYKRRMQKLAAERQAKKAARGKPKGGG